MGDEITLWACRKKPENRVGIIGVDNFKNADVIRHSFKRIETNFFNMMKNL